MNIQTGEVKQLGGKYKWVLLVNNKVTLITRTKEQMDWCVEYLQKKGMVEDCMITDGAVLKILNLCILKERMKGVSIDDYFKLQ